jgi:predicted transcriptional regulator
MKTRRLNIGIRNSAERAKALYEAVQRVTHGDHTPQEPELYFENVEQLRRMLTNKRLDLLHTIARHHPTSVHQLAELVHRDYKNVSTDIELLERLGLVNVGAPTGKGRSHALSVPYDEIRLTIKLGQRKKLHAA